MGICDYRHTLVNLIIALEGILLLTDGAHRQRFYEVYSEFTRGEQEDQKLGQVIIILVSVFIFTLTLSSNILLRLASICVYSFYLCFSYNLAKYNSASDLAIFVSQILVMGLAVSYNVDAYIAKQNRESQSKLTTQKSQNTAQLKSQNQTKKVQTKPSTEQKNKKVKTK